MWRHGGFPFLYPGEGRERVSARPGEAVRRLGGAVGCAREGMAEAKMRVSVESEARTEAWRVLHGARPLSFPSRRVLGEETGRQWQRHSCLSPHHAPTLVTNPAYAPSEHYRTVWSSRCGAAGKGEKESGLVHCQAAVHGVWLGGAAGGGAGWWVAGAAAMGAAMRERRCFDGLRILTNFVARTELNRIPKLIS